MSGPTLLFWTFTAQDWSFAAALAAVMAPALGGTAWLWQRVKRL